jgi:hypothetical protein
MLSRERNRWFGLVLALAALAPACGSDAAPEPMVNARDNDDEDDGEQAPTNDTPRATDAGRATPKPDAAPATGRTGNDAGGNVSPRDAGGVEEGSSGRASDAGGPSGDARVPPSASGASGALPAVSDVAKPGPFTPTSAAGPSGYVLFHPKELGKDGIRHPIVSWGPGAAENASSFMTLLNHLASHGFAVIAFNGTPQGDELTQGIDWLLGENERADSVFFDKLDATKISAGGHSAGSLATFRIAQDARLTTTLHLCGGTFEPHTDIENLHAPALFLCGEAGGDGLLVGDVARPNCDIDFGNAAVPVFYGVPKGASHMSPTELGDAALRSKFAATCVSWLRWQLAGDQTQAATFVGDDCTLCKDASWTAKQKNWP